MEFFPCIKLGTLNCSKFVFGLNTNEFQCCGIKKKNKTIILIIIFFFYVHVRLARDNIFVRLYLNMNRV